MLQRVVAGVRPRNHNGIAGRNGIWERRLKGCRESSVKRLLAVLHQHRDVQALIERSCGVGAWRVVLNVLRSCPGYFIRRECAWNGSTENGIRSENLIEIGILIRPPAACEHTSRVEVHILTEWTRAFRQIFGREFRHRTAENGERYALRSFDVVHELNAREDELEFDHIRKNIRSRGVERRGVREFHRCRGAGTTARDDHQFFRRSVVLIVVTASRL